jgi:hypothetical protein
MSALLVTVLLPYSLLYIATLVGLVVPLVSLAYVLLASCFGAHSIVDRCANTAPRIDSSALQFCQECLCEWLLLPLEMHVVQAVIGADHFDVVGKLLRSRCNDNTMILVIDQALRRAYTTRASLHYGAYTHTNSCLQR